MANQNGYHVHIDSMAELRAKLAEIKNHFQGQVNNLNPLEGQLQDTFFGGGKGETGAFQRAYQAFGTEWLRTLGLMISVDQEFVDLIDQTGEAVHKAMGSYRDAEDFATAKLDQILREIEGL